MVNIRLPMKKKKMVKRSQWTKSKHEAPSIFKINVEGLNLFDGGE